MKSLTRNRHPIRWIRPARVQRAWFLVRRHLLRRPVQLLPSPLEGLRLHIGAGQTLLDNYENVDGYSNEDRPEHFQTRVERWARAEILDTIYEPESVCEIRTHHMFEHISILDVDRTLMGWNIIMKVGGLLWIQVPDFEGCARRILHLKDEAEKEIYYRHIFGSQFGPGEFHKNGFTASRLIHLLEDYGFETKVAYVEWILRPSSDIVMSYPANPPLPDLTAKAIKTSLPRRDVLNSDHTPVAYRRVYPNPELQ